jgi:sigma-70-like protein
VIGRDEGREISGPETQSLVNGMIELLEELSPATRTAFLLSAAFGCTESEIASALGARVDEIQLLLSLATERVKGFNRGVIGRRISAYRIFRRFIRVYVLGNAAELANMMTERVRLRIFDGDEPSVTAPKTVRRGVDSVTGFFAEECQLSLQWAADLPIEISNRIEPEVRSDKVVAILAIDLDDSSELIRDISLVL